MSFKNGSERKSISRESFPAHTGHCASNGLPKKSKLKGLHQYEFTCEVPYLVFTVRIQCERERYTGAERDGKGKRLTAVLNEDPHQMD